MSAQQTKMIEINLNAPTTPEERQLNIIGNVCLVRGSKVLTYADEDEEEEAALVPHKQQLSHWAPSAEVGKPQVRFFSIGPGSYQILCPLCKQTGDAETTQMAGILGNLSCVLSLLSCCFPIFWLSFAYCCLQSRYKTKRLFCNKCGGHLGFHYRPT